MPSNQLILPSQAIRRSWSPNFSRLAGWRSFRRWYRIVIGKVALGLRSDYLAIATLGISEIIIFFIKNEEWLTRGVKNVNGLPRPVPRNRPAASTVVRGLGHDYRYACR